MLLASSLMQNNGHFFSAFENALDTLTKGKKVINSEFNDIYSGSKQMLERWENSSIDVDNILNYGSVITQDRVWLSLNDFLEHKKIKLPQREYWMTVGILRQQEGGTDQKPF